jgi:hypothetical protein
MTLVMMMWSLLCRSIVTCSLARTGTTACSRVI